jgi:hypothetical protein
MSQKISDNSVSVKVMFIFSLATTKFNMAAAKSEIVLTLVSDWILMRFSGSANSKEEQPAMLLLWVVIVFNMAAAKPKIVQHISHFYF